MLSSKSAHRVRLSAGTLVILLALIGWGLQYKTSLYHNFFQTSPDPPAKLLSDAERPCTEQISLASVASKVRTKSVSHSVLAAAFEREPARAEDASLLVLQVAVSTPLRARTHFLLRAPPLS